MVPKLILGILGLLIGCIGAALVAGSAGLSPVIVMVLIIAVLIALKLIAVGGDAALYPLIGIGIGAILAILGVLNPSAVADGAWLFVALLILALAL
jgi:hypothetical protein